MNPETNQPLKHNKNLPQTSSTQNILSTDMPRPLDRYWKFAKRFFVISSVLVLLLGILGFAAGQIGAFVLIMVDLFVMAVAFQCWVVAKIYQHFSKNKSARKQIKIMLITLAIIILPGYVILPAIGGVWDKYADKRAEEAYEKCMVDHTSSDSPKIDTWSSDQKLKAYWAYYGTCEKIRPTGYYFYP